MRTIDGRQYASRADLIERSGYSDATLRNLWADREANGHPAARREGRTLYWELREWEAWFAAYQRSQSGVDRSGNPDEELPPADQARVLGIDVSAISHYRENPPPGWPAPVRVEELPSGRVREYRTRRQLWAYADSNPMSRSRAGVAGRKPAKGPDPRITLAAEVLAAEPDRKAGEVAAALAERHGGGLSTWKRIVTAARKQT
ncbi:MULTISPECIES: hypothetical protein [unclassified Streptomyces]|uniref:hypothetical protein n=1 Tax=unclassified Streptomyces TaxID=2593676 RepID=UPI0007484040|nr:MULTISPECIES: hypothetical protein [unclassified Streptomyces]KUL73940.1 hypothetical protein ADL34_18940 [Streptomyces sp. NRRL WC-3605]KUL74343.1 hypothetical protein ADL33_17750 [Streptomyces sp. NRRL WC-3604]